VISVLIPTFNTDVSPLVDFLLRQNDFSSFKMEIIIWDDASNIASLDQCDNENISFFELEASKRYLFATRLACKFLAYMFLALAAEANPNKLHMPLAILFVSSSKGPPLAVNVIFSWLRSDA